MLFLQQRLHLPACAHFKVMVYGNFMQLVIILCIRFDYSQDPSSFSAAGRERQFNF